MRKYIFLLAFTVLSKLLFAQNVNVQGQVNDKDGGIPGATIIEKDVPGNGASTGIDGKFRITLRGKSHVLVIKAIGYLSKEVTVGQSTTINVSLEADVKGLEEVVVVGYGTTKKATLTGALSSVSGQEIRRNPSASLQNTLAGRLPGFSSQQTSGQPGSDGATFFIRGIGSYTGSNQPLIIVDDIEFTYAQFARLDANEIESLSILKDASTTAVYGIKGANGVVLVTTRRGAVGPPSITFRSEYALSQPTRLPKFLDAYESAKLVNQARINDGLPILYTDADLEHWRTGDDPYGHPNVNWKDVLFRKFSYQWRNNFDISGGNDIVKYFASVGMINQNGLLNDFSSGEDVNNNFYYKRYNYRSNIDIKATKTLNVKLDLFGNIGERNSPVIPNINGIQNIFYFYNSYLTLAPFAYPIYNPDGSYGYSYAQPGRYSSPNIVQALTLGGYSRDFENNMNINAAATQKLDFITKGLSLRGAIAYGSTYSYSRGLSRGTYPAFIYNPADGSYTPKDPNVFRVGFYSLNYSPGSTTRTINPQASLNYDRTFGSHHLSGLVLYNNRTYFGYNDANNSSRVLNFIPVPTSGFSGRVGYDYKGKYLAEFNVGYNKTEVFASGKKYGFFPAGSIGYNVSEEEFFKENIKFIDRLKFRASYGLVGTDDIGNYAYAYLQTYNNSGSVSFGTSHNAYTAIFEGRLANADVTWEKVKKLNIGMDLSMFKGHITSTLDVFNDDRYDILTNRGTVSYVFGQALPPVNLGKTNNRGFELELAYNDKIGKDFNYRVGGNISVAKNKIVFQDEALPLFPYQRYTGNPINTPKQFKFLGFYQDAADVANSAKPLTGAKPGDLKYADLNGDGVITDADQSYFGYSNNNTTAPGYGFYKAFISRANSELIFTYTQAPNKDFEGHFLPPSRNGGYYSTPTQNLVDQFDMRNGKQITDPTSGYNAANPYVNRDPRFGYTVIYNGSSYANNSGAQTPVFTYVNAPSDGTGIGTTSGYYGRKMCDVNVSWGGSATADRGYPLIRYAEILLNYAEALNELGQVNDALTYIFKIRERAGILPGTDARFGIKAGISQAELRDVIIKERRTEMAFEDMRFYDERRWKIAEVTENAFNKVMMITPKTGTTSTSTDGNSYNYQITNSIRRHNFRPANYLLPIPQSEILKLPSFLQNPGY